jgi:hypothetical protein
MICPKCRKRLKWTGSTDSYSVYTCTKHGDFHRHYEKPDHDHGGGVHV